LTCDAVAIRLQDGEDYPYFKVSGFPEEFVEMESRLCTYDSQGEVVRDGITNSIQDKVLVKLEFVKSCHAVYAHSIGSSSTRRLMQLGVQPVIVKEGSEILGLLNEISRALAHGGVAWIDKAKAKAIQGNKSNDSFSVDAGAARMTSEVGQETAL